ncbi:MAG: beta-hydroxyacyl-ACP dehydratase [Flavobacterium sp.]|nr:beta-hydroxyacyl-ACP dehydratase [Flavobacterium sp.]
MTTNEIIAKLPYDRPFLFVDELYHIDENGVEGSYTFDQNLAFYQGHFKGNPVTPGVILTEVMAQIGVVCLGLFLINDALNTKKLISLTSVDIEFYKPVYPNEKVTVKSEKIYFRFGKLKCKVFMTNENNELVCSGMISGMILK